MFKGRDIPYGEKEIKAEGRMEKEGKR